MRVTVHTLEGGKDTAVGTISWNGGQYELDPPNSALLREVALEPVYIGGKVYSPEQGDEFLAVLCRQYRGAYLRVSKPEGGAPMALPTYLMWDAPPETPPEPPPPGPPEPPEPKEFGSAPDTSLIGVGNDSGGRVVEVRVDRDWGSLKAVVVGRIENDTFPPAPWQPTVPGLPKEGGARYADFAPKQWRKAVKQLEGLCELLEKEGVEVYRPPLVLQGTASAHPVGLTQVYVREAFTVVGGAVFMNQTRAPYRRKEARALEGMFRAPTRLPPVSDFAEDSPPDDPAPYLEGGDVFRLGKDVIVTMTGLATSPAGYRYFADHLAEGGVDAWPAYVKDEHEHGDYVLSLVREGLCLACRSAFVDGLLPSPITDWACVEATSAEAENMACNALVLRENAVVLQEGVSRRVVRALERKGVDVIEVPFDGVAFFGGSVDCATNDLLREGP